MHTLKYNLTLLMRANKHASSQLLGIVHIGTGIGHDNTLSSSEKFESLCRFTSCGEDINQMVHMETNGTIRDYGEEDVADA